MRAENTFSVDFIIRLCKEDKKEGIIYARITVDGGLPKEISLKHRLKARDWNPDKEEVKGTGVEVKHVNDYISKVRFRITEKYRMLEDQNAVITADTVKKAYLGNHITKNSGHTLTELMTYHTKINTDVLAEGTMKNYVATEAYVKNFLKAERDREDIFLVELDYQFMTDFEYYIRNHPIKDHDPCKGNGVYKHLERVKKMVKWSKKLNWIKTNPFEGYTLNFKKSKRKKLQLDEVIRISSQKFNDKTINYVRDLFIFACYTGFGYGDTLSLNEENLFIGNDGKLWCNKYRQKTDELSPVPLLKKAMSIIEKYRYSPESIANGTIFPPMSNQEVNRSLKIIREVCGIKIELTFHIARHTFATTIALKHGVPFVTVSRILGHTKLTTTEIYTEVDEEKIQEDMAQAETRIDDRIKERTRQLNAVKKSVAKSSLVNLG